MPQPANQNRDLRTNIPGPNSKSLRAREDVNLAPGAQGYPLVHEGRSYDSTAILGVAHRYATGRLATSDEVGGDPAGAALLLRKRGFVVTGPVAVERVAGPSGPRARTTRSPARAAAPARRPAAAPERVAPICPTCSMTLPATGVCDDCG